MHAESLLTFFTIKTFFLLFVMELENNHKILVLDQGKDNRQIDRKDYMWCTLEYQQGIQQELVFTVHNVVAARQCFCTCLSVIPLTGGGCLADTSPQADTPGQTQPPSRQLLQRTVRILLECILVYSKNTIFTQLYSHNLTQQNSTRGWSVQAAGCVEGCTLMNMR